MLIGSGVLMAMGLIATAISAETVTGMVYAAGRDEAGAVSAVVIDTPGDAYAVVQDAKGSELLGLENRKVEATGAVSKDEFSNQVISVASFRVIE